MSLMYSTQESKQIACGEDASTRPKCNPTLGDFRTQNNGQGVTGVVDPRVDRTLLTLLITLDLSYTARGLASITSFL